MTSNVDEQIKQSAKALAGSVTAPGIIEWLQGWIDMNENHPQYPMRDDQIKIGKMALKEQTNDQL